MVVKKMVIEKQVKKIYTSNSPKVSTFLKKLDSKQKDTLLKLREVILTVDNNIYEDIKWKDCLVFMYKGKNIIQSVLGKGKTTLIFFNGVKLHDPQKILWGTGKNVRSASFTDTKFAAHPLRSLVKQSIKLYN